MTKTPQPALQDEIFRAYDIRGIVGAGLDSDVMFWLGKAIGSEALYQKEATLLLGCDARLSSPEFSENMKAGILATGCHVVDLGRIPTPLLYFATHHLEHQSGVMITGSHNPKDYNGVKVLLKRKCLSDSQIRVFRDRIFSGEFYEGKGRASHADVREAYLNRICEDIRLTQTWKLVIDCGNAITAEVAPELFSRLGCEVVPLFCEVDGAFPNHHPDPTIRENLSSLLQTINSENADLGIAFDGDGDRVVIVSASGRVFDADQLLMAFSKDILPDNPGATVVFDVKSSQHLPRLIQSLKGQPLMCKSGHSFVKKALAASGAILGGEFSAHLFFKHRWYGFDDGMYAAARFIELLDKNKLSADLLMQELPASIHTPELFIAVPEQEKFLLMKIIDHEFSMVDAQSNRLDGLRIELEHAWGLIRASNTTPNLVLRFEADDEKSLQAIMQLFRQELQRILPQLNLNF